MQKLKDAEKATSVKVLTNGQLPPNETRSNQQRRFLDKEQFYIEQNTYIYKNVTVIISQEENRWCAVEIFDSKLAKQQKNTFDNLWKLSESTR